MKSFIVLALVGLSSANHVLSEIRDRVITADAEKLTGQALVDYVNSHQQLFKAKLNKRFSGLSEAAKVRAINGVAPSMEELSAQLDAAGRISYEHLDSTTLPDAFDSRTAWPACPSIGLVRDQSNCGSCWSMATGEVISDRICVASGGQQLFNISSDDIMSCCHSCGSGCNGGNPLSAMKWYVSTGVVTGSNYEEKSGCLPYPFEPCEHHNDNTHYTQCDNEPDYSTPRCSKACVAGYSTPYAQDKHYGKSSYGVGRKVADIQKEIFTNGPVSASFNVYEDFEQYSSGIYSHTSGKYLGGHAVKLIGWGEENGTPYWLVVNSWNEDWGEKGLFRIIRGTDNCGFESNIVAGLPKL